MSDADEFSESAEAGTGGAGTLAEKLALTGVEGNLDPRAAAFLEEQTRLVRLQIEEARLQIEELKREDSVRHWSLRVRHINDLLKLAFAVSGAVVVTVVAFGLLALVWSAHEATGLIIQPLKAPPDFAARGLDGTVLAQRLLDKLNGDIRDADKWSFRAADNVSGNWGNDSKVQIPETGISIFELTRFLRQWLGHETSMSGEVFHTASGIALTVRVGVNPGATFEGREQDIDALLSQAAQQLLKETQPYRYVWMLYGEGRPVTSIVPIAEQFAAAASDGEQAWRRSAWEETLQFSGRYREAEAITQGTVALAPHNAAGVLDLAPSEWAMGHLEYALNHIRAAEHLLKQASDFAPSGVPFLIENCESFADSMSGAYADAVSADLAESKTGTFDFNVSGPGSIANDLALDHDGKAARAVLAQHRHLADEVLLVPEYITTTGPDMPNFFVAATNGNWGAARKIIEQTDDALAHRNNANDVRYTLVWPWLAYSLSQTGAPKVGEALIAKTPLDCTLCLEMRGRLSEESSDLKGAAYWYNRAAQDAPSIPFSYTDWGAMLLRHGDIDGAIAKFSSAKEISPHFADPLEMWGEALIAKNRSDLALAKFEEANKYAPHWGRLHLKWGEALFYLGRKDEARAQFQAASGNDLSVTDRAALSRWLGGVHG